MAWPMPPRLVSCLSVLYAISCSGEVDNASADALRAAVRLAQKALIDAGRGREQAHVYLGESANATRAIEALRPTGCGVVLSEAEASGSKAPAACEEWRRAAQEVRKVAEFFRGLGSLGRREVSCDGHTRIPWWERGNLSGAMMDEAANRLALEAAFSEVVSALRRCAPGGQLPDGQRAFGPFIPTSGTLVALVRYGDLIGELPRAGMDIVDGDLDFFVLSPDKPSRWRTEFTPCIFNALGVLPDDVVPKPDSPVWTCFDFKGPVEPQQGQSEVSESTVQWLDSDHLMCFRRPPPGLEGVDLMEQAVFVDLVRLMVMKNEHGAENETLGGWQRLQRIPIDTFTPISSCRMRGEVIPCPRDPAGMLAQRSPGRFSSGLHGCPAVPEVTSDRCSYLQANTHFLHSGLHQEDLDRLRSVALELDARGHASFSKEHGPDGCATARWSKRRGRRLSVDARLASSVRQGNRPSTVGADPLRTFFFRFRMAARLLAARLSISPSESADKELRIGNWEDNCFMVRPMYSERLGAILRYSSQLVLGLQSDAAAATRAEPGSIDFALPDHEEFRHWRPLEYCAALLIAMLLMPERRQFSAKEIAWRCDLERGPATSGVARELWGPTILLLRRLFEGHNKPIDGEQKISILVRLCQDAGEDYTQDSWLSMMGPATSSVSQKKGALHNQHEVFVAISAMTRLLVARWALAGSVDTEVAVDNPDWCDWVAFETHLLCAVQQIYDKLKGFAGATLLAIHQQDPEIMKLHQAHWPQAGCASLLLRAYFGRCREGHADQIALLLNLCYRCLFHMSVELSLAGLKRMGFQEGQQAWPLLEPLEVQRLRPWWARALAVDRTHTWPYGEMGLRCSAAWTQRRGGLGLDQRPSEAQASCG
eukprot:TRINITY_DN21175_c0_g1_i1.p1 TRINITY_DN21175_c0_g1~~TRINITY_DN21175_c0_g1_i1.p1  ORF type:complete len:880 (+),score=92.49 TRINITY_DN21175_c0_g1_i1:120-2759(+)